jgi:Ca2+-binding RTX toxin-like protein
MESSQSVPKLQIVLTLGQSLATGTASRDNFRVLSTLPPDPDKLLMLNFGHIGPAGWGSRPVDQSLFRGFTPLVERNTETHVTGMMTAILDSYVQDGRSAPTLLHINAAGGGRSIFQLMTPQSRIFENLESAVAATSDGDIFAISAGVNSFNFYQRTATGYSFEATQPGPIVFMDNLQTQLRLAVEQARSKGFEIEPTIVFNWHQGQSDTSTKYDQFLTELIDSVNEMVDQTIGHDVSMVTVATQTRGYGGKGISLDQLQVISERADVVLGAVEYEFQARYPARVNGDYTHLNAEGYYQLGQRIGRNIYSAISGNENQPILIEKTQQIDPRTVIVDFSGVDTYLVDDSSRYDSGNMLVPPPNFGFTANLNNVNFSILSAEIIGARTVKLTFAQDVSGEFTLSLGRSPVDLLNDGDGTRSLPGFGGTTLRDAGRLAVLTPSGGTPLTDPFMYEFAPIQTALVAGKQLPQIVSTMLLRSLENRIELVDLNSTHAVYAEGSGLTYSITGGADAHLFIVDPITGRVSFKSAPDHERPADSDQNNRYLVTVAVRDGFGLSSTSSLTIDVLNENEAPVSLTASSLVIDRNALVGSTVGWLRGVDPDAGNVLSYSLVSQAAGFFGVERSTGRVFVTDTARLAGFAGSTATMTARVADSAGLRLDQQFDVVVAGQAPTEIRYVGTTNGDSFTYLGLLRWIANGGGGSDRLTGGSNDDSIFGEEGNDTLSGLGGNDHIDGGNGIDSLLGGDGNDTLILGAGNDVLNGGAGDDLFIAGLDSGIDQIDGGAGFDTIRPDGHNVALNVTRLVGIEAIDANGHTGFTLVGGTAHETINLAALRLIGIALIDAGAGNDTVTGSAGDDTLMLGAGNDRFDAGAGDDLFLAGHDGGIDQIDGGIGVDTIRANASNVALNVTRLVGIEAIDANGHVGFTLVGSTAHDTINLAAIALTDIALIDGGAGNDTVTGSAGDDRISGGIGADWLYGGPGRDVFVYGSAAESAIGSTLHDRIGDFQSGIDLIDLSGFDADDSLAGRQSFTFIGQEAFTGLGQLRIGVDSLGNVALFGNTTGTLASDFQISLLGFPPLQPTDLIL